MRMPGRFAVRVRDFFSTRRPGFIHRVVFVRLVQEVQDIVQTDFVFLSALIMLMPACRLSFVMIAPSLFLRYWDASHGRPVVKH
ncbi:MAG: hypothetical protein ACREJQ_06340, partial [bacterium]